MSIIAEKTVETVTQAVKEAVDGAKYLQTEISGQRAGAAEISRGLEAIVSSEDADLATPAPETPSVDPVDESMFEQETESVDDLSL